MIYFFLINLQSFIMIINQIVKTYIVILITFVIKSGSLQFPFHFFQLLF
jgi:hypothetical protein